MREKLLSIQGRRGGAVTEKPRILYIPPRGLHWFQQYANVGDRIAVWPILGGGVFTATVAKIKKNKYGRISYVTDKKALVMTEELTPYHHQGTVGP